MPYKESRRLERESAMGLLRDVDNFLFDCDGVIWHWPTAIAGSVQCINRLKSLGKRCYFVTNNSTKTRRMLVEMIGQVGIESVSENEIVCTAWILAGYLASLDFAGKVYTVGNKSMAVEMDAMGVRHCGIGSDRDSFPDPALYNYKHDLQLDSEVKCVAVGFDHYFSYPKMVLATTYAHKVPGCLFVATNDDAMMPTDAESRVVIPGTGTFVNALRTSVGREPVVLGKPHRTMWDTLAKLHGLDPARTCMVGDRLDTDIAFAANCSLGFSLAVLTGVTNEPEILAHSVKLVDENGNEAVSKCAPDFYTKSLAEFYTLLQPE